MSTTPRHSAVWSTTVRRLLVWPILVLALSSACTTGDDAAPVVSLESATRPETPTTVDGAGDPAEADRPGLPEGWQPAPLLWGPCETTGITECATLEVPLDWQRPDGRSIELAIGREPATGDRIGPLIMNPGGPGGSGLEFLSYSPVSPEVAQRFDLVSWDPRGVGASTPLQCGADTSDFFAQDPSPDTPEEQAALDASGASIAESCGAADAELLEHIGTWNVARDVEAIRLALGAEPLNFIGFSYGTHIGQAYAELFPGQIRTMVLDGVVDPAEGFEEFLLGQTAAFDAAFERNVVGCRDAGATECGVDDLGAAFDEVARRVEAAPLPAGDRTLGPGELGTAAVLTSYSPDGWMQLGPALADGLAGDGEALWTLAASYYDFGSYGAYAGVVCTDSPPPEGPVAFREFAARAAAVSPRFGAGVANEMLPCATWPADPSGTATPITAPGAPPILVVGNTGDAATPYENAVTVADRLNSGVLVSADIDGHTAYGSNECVTRVVDDYLIRLVVPEADPACT